MLHLGSAHGSTKTHPQNSPMLYLGQLHVHEKSIPHSQVCKIHLFNIHTTFNLVTKIQLPRNSAKFEQINSKLTRKLYSSIIVPKREVKTNLSLSSLYSNCYSISELCVNLSCMPIIVTLHTNRMCMKMHLTG